MTKKIEYSFTMQQKNDEEMFLQLCAKIKCVHVCICIYHVNAYSDQRIHS